ncbi:Sca4 family protein [Candidatus Tisiphia endosymbiont of Beris chalybata]|uniref:Sca4 family protein n=1 Tax=Candidatus Tisiphia endosymbiont of Beris chalybata TaxID=3066262 RepID=UPI00312CB0AB
MDSEITEQIEEAQDSILTNIEEELDPITKAIRQEILLRQFNILKNYIAGNLDATVDKYDDQEFNNYLKNINNREIVNQIFLDTKVKSELEKVEIEGYKKVHHNFADRFQAINWQDSEEQGNIRSKIVKNDLGEQLAILKETTYKTSEIVYLADGTGKQINNYRTIDLPVGLDNKTGPMHLSLVLKDENGRNISKERAVYFTAHYDSQGKLQEVSSPKPVKFNGEGDEAIGYIEHQGHIYTLPVTQGKYKEMLRALEQNKGLEVNLSQVVSPSSDLIVTSNKINTVNQDIPQRTLVQDKIQYHQERKKEAEEILQKTSEFYKLAKKNAKFIVDTLELAKKKNDTSNRLLLETFVAQFQKIHGVSPKQAISKYQEILDKSLPTITAKDQEREELQQLTQQNPAIAEKAVEKHLINHAIEYQKEQQVNPISKVSQWFKQAIKTCGSMPFSLREQQLTKVTKIKDKAAKMAYETEQLMARVEAADQSWYKQLQETQIWATSLPEDNPSKKRFITFINLLLEQEEKIKTGKLLTTSTKKNETLGKEHESGKQINQAVENVAQEQDIANSSCKTKTDEMIARLTAMNDPLNKKQFLEKTTKDSKLDIKTDIIVPTLATAKIQLHKTQVNKR